MKLVAGIVLGEVLALAASAATIARVPSKLVRALQEGQREEFVIIDIRSSSQFLEEHIPGAVSVSAATISRSTFSRTASLIVYCGEASCPLSENAANALVNAGYSNVRVLDGGLAAWKMQGFPVESSSPRTKIVLSRDLAKRLGADGPAILDVRSAPEFVAGHLPGSINIPLESLPSHLTFVAGKPSWVVYDRQAARSHAAAAMIAGQGVEVRELAGGIAAWAGDRYPLDVGAAPPQFK